MSDLILLERSFVLLQGLLKNIVQTIMELGDLIGISCFETIVANYLKKQKIMLHLLELQHFHLQVDF